ncbi:PAAR domain-containing protein [Salinisphaera sp. Q1T1-3]|uniref:PAAR domain-containing protein n=1 Tax=Salinisphaera sp. Q1T1-3 TaxID=2321229 RepID=UPI000E755FCE|nr:PAAR domain-containing protein [Salinisphaera sp. Q1T1-3]RJS91680.1 PAAR domain-containing protein [Salinisphaera sp. Q1T1-3]
MTRPVITLGDKTDHGGTVTSAAPTTTTGGKPVARIGDTATCPRCNKSSVRIVSGDSTTIIDGQPVARHGDKTECGATLIAGQQATSTI